MWTILLYWLLIKIICLLWLTMRKWATVYLNSSLTQTVPHPPTQHTHMQVPSMVPKMHRKRKLSGDLEMDQPGPKRHIIESTVSRCNVWNSSDLYLSTHGALILNEEMVSNVQQLIQLGYLVTSVLLNNRHLHGNTCWTVCSQFSLLL